jgi:hypothetical protein
MKRILKALGIVGLCLVAVITFFNGLIASTGCSYPTTHDSWSDKVAGDFFTIADVNQLRCGIEKLMTGPIRPLTGSESAPSYSWLVDSNTGLYRHAEDQFNITTGGANRGNWSSAGLSVLTTGDLQVGQALGIPAIGKFSATKGGLHFSFNVIEIANGASVNLEHGTNAVGGTHGMLWIMTPDSVGKGCQYYFNGAGGAVTLGTTFGACATTDAGTTIAVYHDGDGTYTLKNRLGSDIEFALMFIGG